MRLAQLPAALAFAAIVQGAPASAASWLWHDVGIVGGHYVDGPIYAQVPYLHDMLDKNVIGSSGEFLGRVVAVNAAAAVVEVQLPSGVQVALDGRHLVDGTNAVHAPELSVVEMQRLAELQTGRAVASR